MGVLINLMLILSESIHTSDYHILKYLAILFIS